MNGKICLATGGTNVVGKAKVQECAAQIDSTLAVVSQPGWGTTNSVSLSL